MFVQDFIEVQQSLEAVLDQLVAPGWLQAHVSAADVTVRPPRHRGEAMLVPFTLELETQPPVALSGDLELIAMPGAGTHLVVSASYPRPRGLVRDHDVTRNVATAVRKLLRALDAALVPGETLV